MLPIGVYRAGPHALKIFSGDASVLKAKEAKIRDFPAHLPAFVLAPIGPVTDRKSAFLGYGMPLVEGAIDVRSYGDRKFREAKIPQRQAAELLVKVGVALGELHRAGLIVGDLNDGNILVKDEAPYFIDADSYQFGRHFCTVAHERFLDPRLYGVELTRQQRFAAETDWYAFDVIVFSTLLFVHPYGGVLAGSPTMLRRAEAHASILRPGVKLPKTALLPECMSDALLERLNDTFERDRRAPFPLALLAAPWTRCSCGLEHQRASCPACPTLVPVSQPVERRLGRVVASPGPDGAYASYRLSRRARRQRGEG